MNISFDKESLDILAQLDEKLLKDGDSTIRSDPHVYKKKDTVVYIKNLQEQAKFLSLLRINSSLALTIGIEKSIVTALILNNLKGVGMHDSVSFAPSTDIPIPLTGLGNIIDFTGAPIIPSLTEQENKIELQSSSETVGLISGLQDAPYKRNLVSRQLYTGHMRIDLNQPMVENNFIVLKGPSNAGKNLIVKDMIHYFLNEETEEDRRVVYITSSLKDARNLHENVLGEERSKCTVVSAKEMYNNAAEVYLMPRAGLVLAQKLVEKKCNVLLIFDQIIDYDVKEKQIFDNAKQPFAPTNIFSEIMENCGDFGPGKGKLTSLVVADTDTLNIEYERSMTNLRTHLESIADQIIEFEPSFKSMKSSLPKLDLLTFTGFNQDYWQKPLIASIRKDLEHFSHLLKDAYRSNQNMRDYGFQEDPWENYLYHDSQFIIPLINHQEPLDIITQILLFKFIHRTVGDDAYADSDWNECISEHLQKPKDLIASLKHFAKSYDEFPNQRTIVDIIQTHLSSDFPKNSFEDWNIAEEEVFKINELIDQFLKMFYMNAKINGGLRPHKLDYWKNIV